DRRREVEVGRNRNGGDGRDRTGEWRFCRPLPYHLATSPSQKIGESSEPASQRQYSALTPRHCVGDHAVPRVEHCGVAQLVERRIVNPVVGGSSPPATAKLNNFRTNDLTEPSSSASSTVSAQVSNRASNHRRDDIVSLRLERDDLREGVLAFTPAHGPQEPHLAHRTRRLAPRPPADHREVDQDRTLPGAEGMPLGPRHPLRPRRGAPRSRSEEGRSTSPRRPKTPKRVKHLRQRHDRLVGFTYDEAAGVAHFSMYVPGSAGRVRK